MQEATINKEQVSLWETVSWLWKFWGNLKPSLYFLVIMSPISMFFRSYSPILIKNIFDELAKVEKHIPVDLEYIKYNLILFGVFGVLGLLCYIYIQSLRGITNYKLENYFRLNIFKYIIKLGQSFFQKFETGDLTTRLIDDVSEKKLAWFACSGIFRTYEALIIITYCVYFMFSLSPILTIATLIPLTTLLSIYIMVSKKTIEYTKRTQESISVLNSFLTTTFDGIKIIKSYAQEKNQQQYFYKVVENQKEKEIALVKVSSLLELTYSRIPEVIRTLAFLFGSWLVITNKIPLGTLIAFNIYIFTLIWPIVDVGQFFLKGRGASVSVGRIKELENFEPDIFNKEHTTTLANNNLDWDFKKVSYVFPNGNKVLKDISFSVKQGEFIAIAGSLGAGKSTFINFIPRIIDPYEGEVLLNKINIKDYDLFDLRKKIGFAPQNPSLFSDTIKENILFGRKEISQAELEKAIKVAQLEKEIESFPDKLETLVGQRGVTLSGGQKQRVAIARAIVEKPEILVLDDCTSALDAETESKLWNELYAFVPGITVFLITHRISTLKKADKIILLKDGYVADIGTHDDLIVSSEEYKKIYLSNKEFEDS
jgi:ATP-binding cassette subfamily B multidrug efflux pump